jgi:hypothetical protein
MKFLVLLLSGCFGMNAFADCPNLSGVFLCPAYGTSQPADTMTVTQAVTNGVTTYTYAFQTLGTSTSSASPAGIIDQGMLKFCDNNKLYLGEISGAHAGLVQAHFIDPQGDYVVTLQGATVQDCKLQN